MINIPFTKTQEKKVTIQPKSTEEEKSVIVEGDLTGRNPIPSERALVD